MKPRYLFVLIIALSAHAVVAGQTAQISPVILEIKPAEMSIAERVASQAASGVTGNSSTESDEPLPRLDRWHNHLFFWVQRQLQSFDRSFVGTSESAVPVPVSPFRIGLEGGAIQRGSRIESLSSADFDISLRLPNLQRRFDVFITTDALSESVLENVGESLRAGVRFDPYEVLDFELGVKLDSPPVGFVAIRAGRSLAIDGWRIDPFAKLFIDTDEGLGAAGSLTVDRWRDRRLFRSQSSLRWLERREQTSWTQTVLYANVLAVISPDRNLSRIRNRDLGSAAGLRWQAGGDAWGRIDFHEVGLFWKRPLRREWLFFSVEPVVRFEAATDWRADPGLRVGVDALFWDAVR